MFTRIASGLFRIRYRLLIVNLVIVAIPLVGVGFAKRYEREMLVALEDDMIHQGQVVREFLRMDELGLRLSSRSHVLHKIARHTGMRLRLLDADGQVVADSRGQGDSATRIRTRREIREALAGRYGSATRVQGDGYRAASSRVWLFAALPIVDNDRTQGVVYMSQNTERVKKALLVLRKKLIRIFLGALATAVVLSLFFAWTISRPLERLTVAAARVAAGSRTETLKLDRRDEIGALSRTIQRMATALDQRAENTVTLAANSSHELKSPITSIRGAAEIVLDGLEPKSKARHFVHNIVQDAKRLDRLVSGLLELSRAEYDVGRHTRFNYRTLVDRLAASYVDAPGVSVAFATSSQDIVGHADHLRVALQNLVDNARLHADRGTQVTIRVSRVDGALRTSVHNVGPVVPQAERARLWQRFVTTRRQHGGSGVGLAIVAAVVRAHGGTTWVDSDGSRGMMFGFALPLASAGGEG